MFGPGKSTTRGFRWYNSGVTTATSLLERIIEPRQGGFSSEHARYVLSLDFSPEEQARYAELAAKSGHGTLSKSEEAELGEFVATNALLTLLQSKARISLKRHNPAA
jgi:hypothetical protein